MFTTDLKNRNALSWRVVLGLSGLFLVSGGTVLPFLGEISLPRAQDVPPPPVSGLFVFQIAMLTGGVCLLIGSMIGLSYRRLDQRVRLGEIALSQRQTDLSHFQAGALLGFVTVVGFALRLYKLNSSLWLDEITPRLAFGGASALQVWWSYESSSNHLLNTLLVNLSVALFGEQEWAIRLPACMFGAATVPVCYLFARAALARWASLCVALLLATSYHHVFFSQNARGYTAYILFSVASSLFLIRGLVHDRSYDWAGYLLTMLLNFSSVPIAAFVFVAHVTVFAAACLVVRSRGSSARPLFNRLVGVCSASAYSALLLYAAVLPEMYVYMPAIYSEAAVGFRPFSSEFMMELLRGISAGLSPAATCLGLIAVGSIGAIGALVLTRRNWLISAILILPHVYLLLAAIALGYFVAPRFFLFVLVSVAIFTVAGVDHGVRFTLPAVHPSFRLAAKILVPVLLSLVSVHSLRSYYRTPKQDFRGAVTFVREHLGSDGTVILVDQAGSGFRFYGPRLGLNPDWYLLVRNVPDLDEALRSHDGRALLVTTLWRVLRIHSPGLAERIQRDWQVIRSFPGTVGDGTITVWRPRVLTPPGKQSSGAVRPSGREIFTSYRDGPRTLEQTGKQRPTLERR